MMNIILKSFCWAKKKVMSLFIFKNHDFFNFGKMNNYICNYNNNNDSNNNIKNARKPHGTQQKTDTK